MSTPNARLMTVMPNTLTPQKKNTIVLALIAKGFVSALEIAALSEDIFITENQAILPDEATGRDIYRNATNIQQRVNLLKVNIKDTVAAPHFQALQVNNVQDDILDMASFQNLFPSPTLNDCEHCASILSPASYFVDLMTLIQQQITDANSATIPVGSKLIDRRPDLWEVPLDCEHTETLVPYLEIVNSALDKKLGIELGADGMQHIAQAPYPMSLPFNFPLQEVHAYIGHFDIELAELYPLLSKNDLAVAKARLRLSTEQYTLITTSDTSSAALNSAYGVSSVNATDMGELMQAKNLVRQTGYTLADIQNLVAQSQFLGTFLFPEGDTDGVVNPATGPNLHQNFDRFHRFIRLAQHLGWSLLDLDWVMHSLSIEALDERAIIQLSKVKQLEEKLRLPLDELSSLWFPLKTFNGNPSLPASDNIFDRTFNSPTVFSNPAQDKDPAPYHPIYHGNSTYTSAVLPWNPLPEVLTEGQNAQIKRRLLGALKITDKELDAIIQFMGTFRGVQIDNTPMSVEKLSDLYRISRFAKHAQLTVIESIALWFLMGNPQISSLDNIIDYFAWAAWLKESKLSTTQLEYITREELSPYLDPGFAVDQVTSFLTTVRQATSSLLINDSFQANHQVMFAPLTKEDQGKMSDFINGIGVVQAAPYTDASDVLTQLLTENRATQQNNSLALLSSFLQLSPPMTQALCELTSKINGQTAYLDLFFDPTKETEATAFIHQMGPMITLVKALKLSPTVTASIARHPEWFGLNEISGQLRLGLDEINNIYQFQQLIAKLIDGEQGLLDYFALPETSMAEEEAKADAFSALTGWHTTQIAAVQDQLNLTKSYVSNIAEFRVYSQLFAISEQLGVNVQLLLHLGDFDELTVAADWIEQNQIASDLLHLLNAQYEDDDWEKAFGSIRETLDEQLRDALAAALIFQLQPSFAQITDQQSLYEFLLMDIKMSGCAKTSLLKQGLDSLQLYIHRCQMGLEAGTASQIPDTWWAWMSHYRVWEANRKVFLYPENYIDPSLRKLQTPIYQELKDELLQGDISEEQVGDVFHNYLRKLEELSTLVIVDSYYALVDKPKLGRKEHTLFLFGHTRTDSPVFYHRSVIVDAETLEISQWNPWQRIDAGVHSKNLSAVYAFSRLFIFWVEQGTKSIQVPKKGDPSSNRKAIVTTATIKYAFQQSRDHWSPPQTIKDEMVIAIDHNHLTNGEDYMSMIRNVIHPDLGTDKRFWNRVYPLHLAATDSSPEQVMILFGDLPRVPATLPAVGVSHAEPTKFVEQNRYNSMLYKAAETAKEAVTGNIQGWVTLVPAMFLSNELLLEEHTLVIQEQATDRSFSMAISEGALQEIRTDNLLIDNYFAEPLGGESIDEGSILGQVSHWPMNEGEGNDVEDHVGAHPGIRRGPEWVEINGFNTPIAGGGGEQPRIQSRSVIKYESSNSIQPIEIFNNPTPTWEAFTFECWLKPDAIKDRLGTLFAIEVRDDVNASSISIFFANTDERELKIELNGNPLNLVSHGLVDGNWHHLAVTYASDSKTLIIYQDGQELQNQESVSTNTFSGLNRLYLGQNVESPSDVDPPEHFEGMIAEMRLWSVARSQDEVNTTMRRELSGTEAGLVGYWPLDEGDGETISDKTANGNDTQSFQGRYWEMETDFPFLQAADEVIPDEEDEDDSAPDPRSVLEFDRSSAIEVANFQMEELTEFTVECWIKSTQMGTILSLKYPEDDGVSRSGIQALTITSDNNDNGRIRLVINSEGSRGINAGFNDGLWHHLVVSWRSASGEVRIFKDGQALPDTTILARGASIPVNGLLLIGDSLDGLSDPSITGFEGGFIGQMAELRFWNVALTADEIHETLTGGDIDAVEGLISNISARHGRVEGINNMPGAFVFDNGNEAFLVLSDNNRLVPISQALVFEGVIADGHRVLTMHQQRENLFFAGPFSFFKLNANSILHLNQRAFIGGPEKVLTLEAQQLAEPAFQRYNPNPVSVVHKGSDKLDFDGPFKDYFWEVFFHIPFLIANTFSTNQQFAEAKKWLEYIFDPRGTDESAVGVGDHAADRFWRFMPFRGHHLEKLSEMMTNQQELKVYEEDPFNPDALARIRIGAFEKAVVMAYIKNLIDWGDYLFAQDNWESITEATMLYVLAMDILGKRPTKIVADNTQRAAKNFRTLLAGHTISAEMLHLEDIVDASGDSLQLPAQPFDPIETFDYFCVPENSEFLAYWDRVEDRLFKIRHCMNIDGVVRQLALFQPPIDPRQLIRAVANGQDILQLGTNLRMPVTPYRFSVLLHQAKELTTTLIQLGDKLLSTLEKKDAESLVLLRSVFEKNLLKLVTKVKEEQINMADNQLEVLQASKDATQARKDYYGGKEFMNAAEIANLFLSGAAGISRGIGQGLKLISAGASLAPDTIDGLVGIQPTELFRYGGTNIARASDYVSESLLILGTLLETGASLSMTIGGYQQRMDEWQFQAEMAELDLQQINQQILGAKVQQTIAQQELEVHNATLAQNAEMEQFLKDKFTNEDLYQWMSGQIAAVYFQTYKLAFQLAKEAEKSFQYERNTNATYIEFGYWNSLKKGLLAGEGLMLSLHQLEKAYRDQHERKLEIEKTISLLQVNPRALLDLKMTGTCNFELSEALFDYDFPGHYNRQIKTLAITIPAVVGPYQNVQATLTQLSNHVILQPNSDVVKFLLLPDGDANRPTQPDESVLRSSWRANQQIAISRGIEDAGQFQLNFQDERYLPFEGTGVVSNWTLNMPKATNRIDYASISDVIIHLRYTADNGGEAYREAVTQLDTLQKYYGVRFLSLGQEFSSAWYAFTSGQTNASGLASLPFTLTNKSFPVNLVPDTLEIGDGEGNISVVAILNENAVNDRVSLLIDSQNVADNGEIQIVTSDILGVAKTITCSESDVDKLKDIVLIMPFNGEITW